MRARTAGGLPILLVTARDALEDRLQGLNAGADDYIVKPFDLLELEARLRAVLRRPGTRDEPKLDAAASWPSILRPAKPPWAGSCSS